MRSSALSAVLTWLELLPVVHDGGRLWCLRPAGRESWRVPLDGGDVRRAVSRELVRTGLSPLVVHSTSWRQERDAVLLTHLAVLAPAAPVADGFERWPVGRRELARGGATWPPEAVEIGQVVEHALRHLAWLQAEDPAIAAALEPAWRDSLRAYRPEPFRVFDAPA